MKEFRNTSGFSLALLSPSALQSLNTSEEVDPYGRRDPLKGAVVGLFSEASDVGDTLTEDIVFERCHTCGISDALGAMVVY